MALSLLAHGGYRPLQTLRPPGYPTLMAAVLGGLPPTCSRYGWSKRCSATLAVGIIGAVGASRFGALAGMLSAGLAALNPVLTLLPATQYAENPLLLLIGLAAPRPPSRRGGVMGSGVGRWPGPSSAWD